MSDNLTMFLCSVKNHHKVFVLAPPHFLPAAGQEA